MYLTLQKTAKAKRPCCSVSIILLTNRQNPLNIWWSGQVVPRLHHNAHRRTLFIVRNVFAFEEAIPPKD